MEKRIVLTNINKIMINIFILFASCNFENNHCQDDVYVPDVSEDFGVAEISKGMDNIVPNCPWYPSKYNETVPIIILKCNSRCSYDNNKFYCVSEEHLFEYLENSCCNYELKHNSSNIYWYEIDPSCGSALK